MDNPQRSSGRGPKRRLLAVLLVAVAGVFSVPVGMSFASAAEEANLLVGKTASSNLPSCGDQTPAKAVNGSVDGGEDDKWCAGNADNGGYLQVDMGSPAQVGRFVVQHASAGSEPTGSNTAAFTISLSTDGTSFTSVVSVAGNRAGTTSHNITPVAARFVRLTIVRAAANGTSTARIYELEAYATPVAEPSSPEPTVAPSDPSGCHGDAPARLTNYIHPQFELTRKSCNADVAVYHDAPILQRPADSISWITEFTTQLWQYEKRVYGACDVPRTLPAPIGPGCERLGAPKPLLVFAHSGATGGHVRVRFDESSNFRSTIDVGNDTWAEGDDELRDTLVHESCHQIEGSGRGVHESPAFEVWGDSKWAEFCVFDFYANNGFASDAWRFWEKLTAIGPGGSPRDPWFPGWFMPLWKESGGDASVMDRFFQLLSREFPTREENSGRNLTFARRMTMGEFVHFLSGAAGRDLSTRAAAVFGDKFSSPAFAQAKRDFPGVVYNLDDCTRCSPITTTNPGPQRLKTDAQVSISIPSASRTAGETLTFSGSGLPSGLRLSGQGVLSGTVATSGSGNASVTITGSAGHARTITFPWKAYDFLGTIRTERGLCLDDSASDTADGSPIGRATCTGSPSQRWSVIAGTYQVLGKCMTPAPGPVTSGTPVVVWTCDGRPSQVWTEPGDGTIRNAASGLCLTESGRDTVTTCGAGAQQWTRVAE